MALKHGQICHFEIPAPDLEGAREFYGTVFGWTFEEMNPSYTLFADGAGGGALDRDLSVAEGGPRFYVEVADIDAVLGQIVAHGGAVATPKTEIGGGHGHFAHFRDPSGNVFGLHSS